MTWGSAAPDAFIMSAGVRQGGVISAHLFSIYENIVLTSLDCSGCTIVDLKVGSFLYADVLILLAPSPTELQSMVDICCD